MSIVKPERPAHSHHQCQGGVVSIILPPYIHMGLAKKDDFRGVTAKNAD
jgi:hypothetical protein